MRALIILCGFAALCALSCAPGKPDVALNSSVRQTPHGLIVINDGNVTYDDVTVKINYGLTGEYETRVAHILPGEEKVIPYSQFVNSSNERFNYSTKAIARVMVRARLGDVYTWDEFK